MFSRYQSINNTDPITTKQGEISVALPGSEDLFADMLQHVVSTEEPNYTGIKVLKFFLAVASAWPYIIPSIREGKAEGGDVEAVLQLLGNAIGPGLVVLNIVDDYFDLIRGNNDNAQFHKGGRKCAGGSILSWAAVSAIPLAATAWYYKDWQDEPEALLWTKVVLTFIVYTFTHTLPFKLILTTPWLKSLLVGIPTLPLQLLTRLWNRCVLSPEGQELKSLNAQELMELKKIQGQMVNSFYGLIAQIKNHGFSWKGCHFEASLPSEVTGLLTDTNLDREKVAAWFLQVANYKDASSAGDSTSLSKTGLCYSLNKILKNIVGTTGLVLIPVSILGYMKLIGDLFYKWTKKNMALTCLLMATPFTATEIMTGYFGWQAFAGAYEYLSHWLSCRPEIPYTFKLNPLISLLLLGIMWGLAWFGYGTALQVFHDSFDKDDYGKFLYFLLEEATKYGIIVYGMVNFAQLVEKIVEPLVKRCGDQQKGQLILLCSTLKRLATMIDLLDPEAIKKILAQSDAQKLAALGVNKETLQEMDQIKTKRELVESKVTLIKSKSSFWDYVCCFRKRNLEATETDSLLSPRRQLSLNAAT